MKKRALYIAVIIICLSIITGGTFAYFSTDDVAHNVITTKKVELNVLVQKQEGGSLNEDLNEAIPVMPGITVSKVISAQGLQTESWARIKYNFAMYDVYGEKMQLSKDELEQLILVQPDTAHWTEKDGWWYCNESLESGEISKPLFKEIKFAGKEMGNEYQNTHVKLWITGQAVQCNNNGNSVLEAAGWPEE